MLTQHGLEGACCIVEKEGFTRLRASIAAEVNVSRVQTIGIVADANASVENRWRSLRDAAKTANCHPPGELPPGGARFDGPGDVRVGIWLMPDNLNPGELEDFVADMVPSDDPLMPLAESYVDGIPAETRRFAPEKRARACVHAWLAVQVRPRPMGTAIAARTLDVKRPNALSFVHWVRELFDS